MTRALMAEFESADAMMRAIRELRHLQGVRVETFTPFDVPEVDEALGLQRSRLGKIAFGGGLCGIVISYAVQWWTAVQAYPLNVGGRPLHAAPAFALITFECGVLGAALAAFAGLCVTLRFPRLWAREDQVEGFERSTIDRFWVRIDSTSANTTGGAIQDVLTGLGVLRMSELIDA